MLARKTARALFQEASASKEPPKQITGIDGLLKLMLGGRPLPTQYRFIMSNERWRAYKGAVGVAKTSTLACAGLLRCLLNPGYRLVVCRYDYNDLMGTTAERMMEMLMRLPPGTLVDRTQAVPERWYIRPIVGDTTKLSVVQFAGLKEYLGSYEFHGALVDEADEVDMKIVQGLRSRLRKPGHDIYEMMLAFNPPDKTHWLYKACTGLDFRDKPAATPWLKLFEPKIGENRDNLPADYWEVISKGMPPDMIDRLIKGLWGVVFEGEAVYREFSRELHVTQERLWSPGRDLLRFWDFGFRRPACIWGSFDPDTGQLQMHHSVLGDAEEVGPFASRVNSITAMMFKGHGEIHDFGDPAVKQKKDTGSTLAILKDMGITMMFRTSGIEDGLRVGRMLLSRITNAKVAVVFEEEGCALLIRALGGGYHLDKSGQKPVKDGFYDHLADAWRYGVINVFNPDGSPMPSSVSVGNRTSLYDTSDVSLEYDPRFDHIDRTPMEMDQ